ncbi:hypothetical protein GCM10018966_101500 [Streptomyces yanii]
MQPSTDDRPLPSADRLPRSSGLLNLGEQQTAALVDESLAIDAARAATVAAAVLPSLVYGSDPRAIGDSLTPCASATHAGVKIGTF